MKLLFSMVLFTFSFSQSTSYYSTLKFVESPLPRLQGSIELTKDIAMKRNHYRFIYDDESRLIEVGFYNGNQLRDRNHTANLFFLSAKIQIIYLEDKEIYSFFDRFNRKTTVLGNVHQFIYELKGEKRSRLYFTDIQRNRIQNNWDIHEYQWTYLNENTVIENRFNNNNEQVMLRPGFEFYRIKLVYDKNGVVELMQYIDEDGQLIENSSGAAQDRIETNEHGQMIAWNVLDKHHELERGNGPNVARGEQTFNEFGYETGIRFFDEDKNPIATSYGFWNSITSFDQFGNMKKRTFLDPNGNPIPHEKAGYTTVVLTYDSSGMNRTKLEYFDHDEKPTIHAQRGYHAVLSEFDSNGNCIKMSFVDTLGSLIERKDNHIAYIEYVYENNTLKATRNFNKFHEKI